MTITTITLTLEEFQEQYPLIPNHLESNASWTYGDGPGCLFETYGEEHAFVRQQHPRNIWTLIDDNEGHQFLRSGYRLVNRIGFLISSVPRPEGTDIEYFVRLTSEDGGEEDEYDEDNEDDEDFMDEEDDE